MKGNHGHDSYTSSVNRYSEDSSSDPCDFDFEDTVQDGQEVLKNLTKGIVLEVKLVSDKVVSLYHGNQLCGRLFSPKSQRMAECIRNGKLFKAIIVDLVGRSCLVRLSRDE